MVKNFSIVLKNLQHAIKTAWKRAIQKTTESTGDLIGNRIADNRASVSKKSSADLHPKNHDANNEIEALN